MARINGEHMGGSRAMKASLRKVKCQTRVHGHSGLVYFLFFFACVQHVGLAYISSDLRTCTQRMFARNISALTGEVRRSPEPSARPSAAADSEERQICTTCLFAESVGLCLCFLPSCAMYKKKKRCWNRGSGDGQRLSLYDYDTTERSFNDVER